MKAFIEHANEAQVHADALASMLDGNGTSE